jgi:hypothetical protein
VEALGSPLSSTTIVMGSLPSTSGGTSIARMSGPRWAVGFVEQLVGRF